MEEKTAIAMLNSRPETVFLNFFEEPRNLFQGIDSASLCSLVGRYDNPITTRFLAPIDCSKIQALFNIQKLKKENNKKKSWGKGRRYTFERETAETVFLNFEGAQESIPLAYIVW